MNTSKKNGLYGVGVSRRVAAKIIELHKAGFVFDFEVLAGYKVFCIQENCFISLKDISIRVIDQCFDQLSDSYKYIHTIESGCGKKGVLLSDQIANYAHLTLNDKLKR